MRCCSIPLRVLRSQKDVDDESLSSLDDKSEKNGMTSQLVHRTKSGMKQYTQWSTHGRGPTTFIVVFRLLKLTPYPLSDLGQPCIC